MSISNGMSTLWSSETLKNKFTSMSCESQQPRSRVFEYLKNAINQDSTAFCKSLLGAFKHVSDNAASFVAVLGKNATQSLKDSYDRFETDRVNIYNPQRFSTIKMSKIGFKDFNTLEEITGTKGFVGDIRSDGNGIELVCTRPRKKNSVSEVAEEIDLKNGTVWGVDPGLRDIFVVKDRR
ncbi:hypothetical protein K501DRAFT_302777 [Backusella circina FSU 941]|nr:hypothetical protein K501DRAFT_302777 [Backusella circina FSU 941]